MSIVCPATAVNVNTPLMAVWPGIVCQAPARATANAPGVVLSSTVIVPTVLAKVLVRKVRAGIGFPTSVLDISVLAGVPSTGSSLGFPRPGVLVEGLAPNFGLKVLIPTGAVEVRGPSPAFGAGIRAEGNTIQVITSESMAGARLLSSVASVVGQSPAPAFGVGFLPAVTSVAVSAGAPLLGVAIRPYKALVWVEAFVPVEGAEVSRGKVVVLNANTLAVSEYVLEGVLDVVEHEGQLLFVTEGEIQTPAISGAQVASITTGELAPLGGQEFNVPKVTIGAAGSGTLGVQTTTKERGAATTNATYSVDLTVSTDQHELLLETRQHARAYQFKVEFTEGGSLLESLDAYVNPVRHRRG